MSSTLVSILLDLQADANLDESLKGLAQVLSTLYLLRKQSWDVDALESAQIFSLPCGKSLNFGFNEMHFVQLTLLIIDILDMSLLLFGKA